MLASLADAGSGGPFVLKASVIPKGSDGTSWPASRGRTHSFDVL